MCKNNSKIEAFINQHVKIIHQAFADWDDIYKNGCNFRISDKSETDGYFLNFLRKRIDFSQKQLKEFLSNEKKNNPEFIIPALKEMQQNLPPIMSEDFVVEIA